MADGEWRRKMAFRFESLEIWHKARAYATKVYALTAKFPRHEDYGLRSQLNRAVNSIGLNIAEGSAKGSHKAFDYHLEINLGSTFEVVGASFLSFDRGYITEDERQELYADGERLAKSINAFRKTLH
ncbi:MAG: four helix bundle protein [Anaerolineae bacterium CG_4_9_14_0_8_um_filter_58_9]|nr:MAG: four helix bundle protein [Anaerolineae bacterium CG06_land_8_20_14_3_00_57_67]PJH76097.1 MAG: four helix bundle protein [Anaerolineae bacterium CG_4_9_14_0_8_um_filter_58_9]